MQQLIAPILSLSQHLLVSIHPLTMATTSIHSAVVWLQFCKWWILLWAVSIHQISTYLVLQIIASSNIGIWCCFFWQGRYTQQGYCVFFSLSIHIHFVHASFGIIYTHTFAYSNSGWPNLLWIPMFYFHFSLIMVPSTEMYLCDSEARDTCPAFYTPSIKPHPFYQDPAMTASVVKPKSKILSLTSPWMAPSW